MSPPNYYCHLLIIIATSLLLGALTNLKQLKENVKAKKKILASKKKKTTPADPKKNTTSSTPVKTDKSSVVPKQKKKKKKTTPPPPPPPPEFSLYQVVDSKVANAKKGRYYRAYIVHCDTTRGIYGVYFPEDSTPQKNTPVTDIRPIVGGSKLGFWSKSLDSFKHAKLHMHEVPYKGEWKIVGFKLETYQFECKKGETTKYFDIGEILRLLKLQIEKNREL